MKALKIDGSIPIVLCLLPLVVAGCEPSDVQPEDLTAEQILAIPSELSDDFNDNSRNRSAWNIGVLGKGPTTFSSDVGVAETNQRLEVSPRNNASGQNYSGYLSRISVDLTDGSAAVEVVQAARISSDADTIFALTIDPRNWYRIIVSHGALSYQDSFAGEIRSVNVAYDSDKHRWWRIRHESATARILWETSTDGSSWTIQHTVLHRLASSFRIELQAGTYMPVKSPGKAIFDNLRVRRAPPIPSPTPDPDARSMAAQADTFDDDELEPRRWELGGICEGSGSYTPNMQVAQRNRRIEISPLANAAAPAFNGYLSRGVHSLVNDQAFVQVIQPASMALGASTIFSLTRDSRNWFRFLIQGGKLYYQQNVNGVRSGVSNGYDASRSWLRLRHAANTIFWETSPNGQSWTTQHTVRPEFPVDALLVELQAGTSQPEAAPGMAIFDNFTSISPPDPSPTPKPTETPSPIPSVTPTPEPSLKPTPLPTPTPIATEIPIPIPSAIPTLLPTPLPTSLPTATPTPSPEPTPVSTVLSAVWANDGGDKITRDEQRASTSPTAVINPVWNGSEVQVFGARNEVVGFNLVLEANARAAAGLSVSFSTLTGPGGATIGSAPVTDNGVFNWTERDIELFYVRYLKIEGLSRLSYEVYDERHIPQRMRRPWSRDGRGTGTWADRPDHDKYYPDIAVPIELVPSFDVALGQNQSIWADIYVPKGAPAGIYTGKATIMQGTTLVREVPVRLNVRAFTLPDSSPAKNMVYLGFPDINRRYTGVSFPSPNTPQDFMSKLVRDRHFQLAHRHKISLIDSNEGSTAWSSDAPRPEWIPRLNGQLFSESAGYAGPGENVGNDVFSVGTYGNWSWRSQGEAAMRTHSDAWANWFAGNSPLTEFFLYLIDESTNYAQTEQWARWIRNNPGPGRNLKSFATLDLREAVANVPSLDIAASWFAVGDTAQWQQATSSWAADPRKSFYMYNGKRPANGSFATEDDGVSLRELAWGQYKHGVDRWFFWESTYYNDFQGGRGQTNVFQNAQTFGGSTGADPVLGRTGWNYSNGDGVLFYPGTDQVFPSESYGLQGPIASLRLKHWRRGIQDANYLELASAIDPERVRGIVNRMVPKVLWENGIADPADPTWVRTDISWSTDPAVWEAAREELAQIIETAH